VLREDNPMTHRDATIDGWRPTAGAWGEPGLDWHEQIERALQRREGIADRASSAFAPGEPPPTGEALAASGLERTWALRTAQSGRVSPGWR
jgi:hypothetical protein